MAESGIRVAIDLTALLPQHSGVDRYVEQLVRHLGVVDLKNCYTLFLNAADRPLFRDTLPPNFQLRPWCPRQRPARFLFQQFVLPAACNSIDVDVLHSPAFLMPYWRGRPRHLLSVHDMTFFSMPEVHNRLHRSRAFRRLVMSSIHRATMIAVPSQAACDTLREWAPDIPLERIRVIPYGVRPAFGSGTGDDIEHDLRRRRFPAGYVLSVGTIEPRKNLDVLVDAYGRLVRDSGIREHLVIAGKPGSAYRALVKQIEAQALTERVHLLGFVADADLERMYRRARLFVYPSRAEGFGFPPLEAMASGVPVVSTGGSSLEENLKGAAELVPPGDIDALAAAMRRLLQDEALREKRRAEGLVRAAAFRWNDTARRIVECYEELGSAST